MLWQSAGLLELLQLGCCVHPAGTRFGSETPALGRQAARRRQHAAAKLTSAPETVQSASVRTSVLNEVHLDTPNIGLQPLASMQAKEVGCTRLLVSVNDS